MYTEDKFFLIHLTNFFFFVCSFFSPINSIFFSLLHNDFVIDFLSSAFPFFISFMINTVSSFYAAVLYLSYKALNSIERENKSVFFFPFLPIEINTVVQQLQLLLLLLLRAFLYVCLLFMRYKVLGRWNHHKKKAEKKEMEKRNLPHIH